MTVLSRVHEPVCRSRNYLVVDHLVSGRAHPVTATRLGKCGPPSMKGRRWEHVERSIVNSSPGVRIPPDAATDIPAGHTVIAAVIEWRGRIALFRRSRRLAHDSGLWHCITGFVEAGATPEQQALEELFEETGLHAKDLLDLRQGPALVVANGFGTPCLVYTFTAVTSRRRLKMDREHYSYRWTTAHKAKRFTNRVTWLESVLDATGHLTAIGPAP